MCGIYGLVSLDGRPLPPSPVDRARAALRHRGPDGSGCRSGPRALLGAERLEIVAPRSPSNQPFASPDGAVWVACNGEIYNAPELRARFSRYPYRSATDIEPIVPLVLEHGAQSIARLNGMFALAVWDDRRRRLVLARDRAGEKPLFYTRTGAVVAFASEIEAVAILAAAARAADPGAVREFLVLGYVREPRTMFRDIRQVEAGTIHTFDADGERIERFWRPERIEIAPTGPRSAAERLDALLQDAVARQLRSDAPVGVFTSGGVDSALLGSLAVDAGGRDHIETFAVGFEARSYDESAHAARLARRLGVRHTTVRVGDQSLHEAFDALTRHLAEPLGDPAALPTWLLAREATQHVKVVLSGEGADELFGGYPTYLGHRLVPFWSALPTPLRRSLRWLVDRLPSTAQNVPIEYLLKRFAAGADEEDWLTRHLAWFGVGLGVVGHPSSVVRRASDDAKRPDATENGKRMTDDAVRSAMLFDYLTYLRCGLLPKIDRTTMRHSLEARAPYLDPDLTMFAWSLPTHLRVRGLTTKWLLKRVAASRLPRAFVQRRKRGLSVPLAQWINRGLRGEVDRLLAADRIARWGVPHVHTVRRMLAEHRAGRANHARALWPLIVLERWAERWL